MAECKVPYVNSPMDNFMQQYFPTGPPALAKKEVEEVTDEGMDGVYGNAHGYSPEENAATSSERDESPDTVSNSSEHVQGDGTDEQKPPILLDETDLHKQLFHLHESLTSKGKEDSLETKPGTKIDCLADRLISAASTPFNPQLGALSALAMQLAAGAVPPSSTPSIPSLPSLPNIPSLHSALAAMNMPMKAESPLGIPSNSLQQQQTNVQHQPQGYGQSPKRKRQRRNPVWPYFIVEDGIARCKQCAYSTRSVFSTNLKVHLRSHHRADYEKVIEAEDQLNLNALLLSGNAAAGLMGREARKRSLPPMTSSILMTISKLAAAGQSSALQAALGGASTPEGDAMNAVRQTLAANQIHNQLKMAAPDLSNLQNLASLVARQQQQMAQSPSTPSPAPPTPTTPTPMQSNEALFSQFPALAALQNVDGANGNGEFPQPKRRRLRRHPVWMFFRDLEDRMVGCINCNFRTGSAFSTNLKMHLKAHHKDDYSKVLKLEDEMRIEEGIFGTPNKIKSELIDFIRGGGNASTPVSGGPAVGSTPTPSPLVQQLIAGNFTSRTPPQTPSSPGLRVPTVTVNNNKPEKEEEFSSLSMTDRLAALVGLSQQPKVENSDEQDQDEHDQQSNGRDLLARLGLLTPTTTAQPTQSLSISALNAFNGNQSGVASDSKSCTSSSVDGSSLHFEDRKMERDRAVARFSSLMGESIVQSEAFKAEEDQENLAPEGAELSQTDFEVFPEGALTAVLTLFNSFSSPSPSTSSSSTCEVQETDWNDPRIIEVKKRLEEAASIEDPIARHKKIAAERMKLKRLTESSEERNIRLEKMRERYVIRTERERKEKENGGGRDEKKERDRLKRNAKMREYQRRRRALAKTTELMRSVLPDYEVPAAGVLASLVSPSQPTREDDRRSESPVERDEPNRLIGDTPTFEQLLKSLQSN